MSFRWPKYLPGYPAVLLMPTVLAIWAILCFSIHPHLLRKEDHWGFPLTFSTGGSIWPFPFLIDLTIALLVAYAVAMIVQDFVFPMLRSLQRRKRGQGESN